MKRHSLPILGLIAMVSLGCAQTGPAPVAAARQAPAASEVRAVASAVVQADRARFDRADRNGDGALTPDELPFHPIEAFAAIDADHDGRLSMAEAIAAQADAGARAQVALEFQRARAEAGLAPGASIEELLAAEPAPDGRGQGNPIVFVPGYLDFEFYFARLKSKLEGKGRSTHYLSIFPNIGDIRTAAVALKALVADVKKRTGAKQVDVVAHSMGGLITRYYIKYMEGERDIERLVTLATPHHGTLVSFASPTQGAKQMHPGSDFLKALNADDETPGRIRYTSIRGGLDEIVIPHSSPILEGAENHYSRYAMHGTIFINPTALRYLEAALAK